MIGAAIDVDGFEAKFQENIDPWNYESSDFEAYKRGVLKRACGSRLYGRGLELACANGATTKVLAPLCLKLLAVDGSPSAVAAAKKSTQHLANVEVQHSVLPREFPRRQFDLIVISELLYYLKLRDIERILARSAEALAPGGRIVCLHHVIKFDDVSYSPRHAQNKAERYFGKHFLKMMVEAHGRFRVSAFKKPANLRT